jgi:pyruvate, orthophosphate dikinase
LAKLHRLNLPIPFGFIITREACFEYLNQIDQNLNPRFVQELLTAIHEIERHTGKLFGGRKVPEEVSLVSQGINEEEKYSGEELGNYKEGYDLPRDLPLHLSVRSDPKDALPDTPATILNLGMNDDVLSEMMQLSSNSRWALDCYRIFLQDYGSVVLKVPKAHYEEAISNILKERGLTSDTELNEADLEGIVDLFKKITGPVPYSPWEQLENAIVAIYTTWASTESVEHRKKAGRMYAGMEGIAITIQHMVHGDLNERSGAGVVKSKDFKSEETDTKEELEGVFLFKGTGRQALYRPVGEVSLKKMHDILPEHYSNLFTIVNTIEEHTIAKQVSIILFLIY